MYKSHTTSLCQIRIARRDHCLWKVIARIEQLPDSLSASCDRQAHCSWPADSQYQTICCLRTAHVCGGRLSLRVLQRGEDVRQPTSRLHSGRRARVPNIGTLRTRSTCRKHTGNTVRVGSHFARREMSSLADKAAHTFANTAGAHANKRSKQLRVDK